MSKASCAILHRAPTFGARVENGKAALKKAHRTQVDMKATCSVDLDTHGPPSVRGEKRWDYVLVNHDGKGHAVEVHPARTSEVGDMIAKKRWAEEVLRREAKGLAIAAWHWVASGRVDVRRHDRSRKMLAEAGLAFPCELLRVD